MQAQKNNNMVKFLRSMPEHPLSLGVITFLGTHLILDELKVRDAVAYGAVTGLATGVALKGMQLARNRKLLRESKDKQKEGIATKAYDWMVNRPYIPGILTTIITSKLLLHGGSRIKVLLTYGFSFAAGFVTYKVFDAIKRSRSKEHVSEEHSTEQDDESA